MSRAHSFVMLLVFVSCGAHAQHVAPDPPQHQMQSMSYREMVDMMQMDDRKATGMVVIDQAEWLTGHDADAFGWEAHAWYGGDYNKLWFRTEGEERNGTTEDARTEVFWDRIVARWWSAQLGIREDLGGQPRTWAAVGLRGVAPYWIDTDVTLYVGDEGRTAVRVKFDYDARFTQRLILRPELEANLYGKSDPERHIGSGLSDLEIGLRLRYELRREIAPYVGVEWSRSFSGTADFARAAGEDVEKWRWTAGVRVWF
jgi:copper resistance protein B